MAGLFRGLALFSARSWPEGKPVKQGWIGMALELCSYACAPNILTL